MSLPCRNCGHSHGHASPSESCPSCPDCVGYEESGDDLHEEVLRLRENVRILREALEPHAVNGCDFGECGDCFACVAQVALSRTE